MMKTLAASAFLSCIFLQNATAQNIKFERTINRQDEQSNLQFLHGGEWTYFEHSKSEATAHERVMLLGRPKRDAYDLLSFQEQQELDRYVQIKLQQLQLDQAQQEEKVLASKSPARMRPYAKGRGLKNATLPVDVEIPKILREEAGSICVPQLAHLNSVDWQAHLVCAGGEK